MAKPRQIRIKRAYDPPARADGTRVLVDRVWPRGKKRDDLEIAQWAKDIAPSAELRKWFGHEPSRWPEFEKRYRKELQAQLDALDALLGLGSGVLTLVYSARDREHNQAVALQRFLQRRQDDG